MRPLNRPMFRYGGPIKEGIMNRMQDRPGYNLGSLVAAGGNILSRTGPFLKNIYQGIRAKPTVPFQTADTGLKSFLPRFIQKALPSQRFRQTTPTITRTKDRVPGATGSYSPINIKPGQQLSVGQVLRDPKRIGAAIRENPFLAISTPSLATSATQIGGPVLVDTAKGIANFLVPGTRFDPFGPKKQEDIATVEGSMTRGTGGPKNIGEVSTDTDKKVRTDAEKQQINEDRIQQTKDRYYKMMGLDDMKKDAVYDSLIDASRIVSEEGADLKGSIKSGSLQNRLIQAIGKNLDKSADLKKAIDSAVLKGEIQKDINLTKPSAFAEQVAYLRNNPNDPLARKLSGVTSVADNLAALADKPLTSDIVSRLVESKGQDVKDVIKDDKYQKWEKNNEGKDEIDYLQDVYKGKRLDPGVYIINKKAFQIDAKGEVNPIDLDSIIG
jgi:hypothetical protein